MSNFSKQPLSVKAKSDAKRTVSEKIADRINAIFGSMFFLGGNAIWFIAWVLINTGQIKAIPPFDPFPFSLLTTIVSLEAIILAIFVLVSQNRSMKVADVREETQLQVNIISEKEITKMMQMMTLLLKKQGIDLSKDIEMQESLKPVSAEALQEKLEKEIL